MSQLQRAMQAANERKLAGFNNDVAEGIAVTGSDFQDRAIFSGFDIEHGELIGTSQAVAELYSEAAKGMGLGPLFISAWCDGLLTGLLLASLPPADEPGATDGPGSKVDP